jgi:negative modulator of initiation of replication
MPTIEIEEDIYRFLAEKVMSSGETVSTVLRKELNSKRAYIQASNPNQTPVAVARTPLQASPLSEFLDRPDFLVHPDVVSRYLSLLSWLYNRDPDKFKRVASIEGRKRRYFALTPKELEDSGVSVMPRRIPSSPFWAVTNNATAHKRRILEQVMRVLSYSAADVSTALSALK